MASKVSVSCLSFIGANLQRIISGTKKNLSLGRGDSIAIKQLLHAHAQYNYDFAGEPHPQNCKQLVSY